MGVVPDIVLPGVSGRRVNLKLKFLLDSIKQSLYALLNDGLFESRTTHDT